MLEKQPVKCVHRTQSKHKLISMPWKRMLYNYTKDDAIKTLVRTCRQVNKSLLLHSIITFIFMLKSLHGTQVNTERRNVRWLYIHLALWHTICTFTNILHNHMMHLLFLHSFLNLKKIRCKKLLPFIFVAAFLVCPVFSSFHFTDLIKGTKISRLFFFFFNCTSLCWAAAGNPCKEVFRQEALCLRTCRSTSGRGPYRSSGIGPNVPMAGGVLWWCTESIWQRLLDSTAEDLKRLKHIYLDIPK